VDAASPEPLDHTRLAAARLRAAEAQPFLAMALYALTAVSDASQPTFAVDERWRLYVNPQKLREWSVLQVAGVLLHEVGHVIRDHAGRARTLAVIDEPARRLWNLAADAEINDDLLAAGITLPPTPVTPWILGMPPDRVAEFYYTGLGQVSALPAWVPDCGAGCRGQGDSEQGDSDQAPLLPAGLSDAEALLLRRRVAEDIMRAATQQSGDLAGGWLRWAEAIMRPRLDWRRLLAAKMKSSAAAVSGAADYSYARPSRRRVPRVVLPSLRRPLPSVAVIVDTSGSVDDDLLGLAWTEVHGCLRGLGTRRDLLTVYAADAAVHRLTGPPRRQVSLTGGGGTDMAGAIEAVLAAHPVPDMAIVITDGLTPWPAVRPCRDVIIALLPAGVSRPPPPSWAKVVEVTSDQQTGAGTPWE
jgi:predicted metal-dependent peptidase